MAETLQRAAHLLAGAVAAPAGERERADEGLAPVGEGAVDQTPQLDAGRRPAADRPTSTESTFGTG